MDTMEIPIKSHEIPVNPMKSLLTRSIDWMDTKKSFSLLVSMGLSNQLRIYFFAGYLRLAMIRFFSFSGMTGMWICLGR